MNDDDLEKFEKVLSAKYLLVRKGQVYYGIGGAIAAITLITGISVQTVQEAVSARIEGEVADAVLDVEARLAEVNALAERANETVLRAEAELEAIRASGPGVTRTIHSSSGEVITERGRGGMMVVTVEGRVDGRPSSTAIDHQRLMELCSDLDGCSVSVAASPFSVTVRSRQLPGLFAPGTGGDCRFHLAEEGHWSLENGCVQWLRQVHVSPDNGTTFFDPSDTGDVRGFRPSNSASGFWIDGDATDDFSDTEMPGTLVVMAYSSLSMMSEADFNPDHRADPDSRFLPDDAPGFFLIMAGGNWGSYPSRLFPVRDDDRQCVLTIRD